MANSVAEQVFGTIGTFLWAFQITPQIWKSWHEKSTEGLSAWLMLTWAIGGLWLGIYVIVQNINIPLIVQPQLFSALAAFSWIQCLYYGHRRSRKFCTVLYLIFLFLFAGLEAGFTFAMKAAVKHGNDRGLQFFGIFSAVCISVGLIPQYIEIWKRREVIGISLVFMAIDMGGGVFSLLSLVFKPKFDVVAAVTYISVVVLDGVIVVAALILNPLARKRHARETLLASENETLPDDPNLEATIALPTEKASTPR